MAAFLGQFNARRIRGEHCLEMVGGDRFWATIRECPGTYFLIPSWVVSFDAAMISGLGLGRDERLKKAMFRNYKQIVYFDTQVYNDSDGRAREIAAFLNLPLQVERVGLGALRGRLAEALIQLKEL